MSDPTKVPQPLRERIEDAVGDMAQADARLHAARALQLLGETARPALPAMQAALAVARRRKRMHDMYLVFSLNAALKKVGQK